eukprot:scaffold3345_cov83-Skeletonema_dohrnii-CCMP3373.AAC.3
MNSFLHPPHSFIHSINSNIDNIDISKFDCIYSPAKRRGPVPGKSGLSRSSSQPPQQKSSQPPPQAPPPQLTGEFNNTNVGYTINNLMVEGPTSTSNTASDLFVNSGFDSMSITSGVDGGFSTHPSGRQSTNTSGGGMSTINGSNANNTSGGVDLNALLGQLNAQQQLNSGGGNNNSDDGGGNNTIGGAEQMKQMILLQQQLMLQQQQIQQQQLAQQLAAAAVTNVGSVGQLGVGSANNLGVANNTLGVATGGGGGGGGVVNNNSLQLLQQYQNSQQLQQQQTPLQQLQQTNLNQMQQHQGNNNQLNPMTVLSGQHHMQQQQQQAKRGSFYDESTNTNYHHHHQQQQQDDMTRSAKRSASTPLSSTSTNNNNIVSTHLPLLDPQNQSGTLLRQYFELSTNNVLNLPPIPSNEEYCVMILQQQQHGMYTSSNLTPDNLPWYDQSALNAARFSQLALGALCNDQVGLALELSNACVLCLKNCVEEPSHKSCLSAVARAYLLHGIFRSLRGDMVRYFKYRRVCMTQIYMLDGEQQDETVDALLAAMSFHDAWAYMMYNATEDALPDIDGVLPRVCNHKGFGSDASTGLGCSQVVTDPVNQMWIQGEPQIFLKNEARVVDRSLDAISCAVRSCCDQANRDFAQMSQSMSGGGGGEGVLDMTTPTSLAVMASENELCSRNMVLSAQALLNQKNAHERVTKPGLIMMITAMDAFLENSDQDGSSGGDSGGAEEGGFSETQIQNLLSACEMAIKHPMLLHSPGPVYHMMSNAAVLLCHLLNGLHAKCSMRDSSSAGSSNDGGAGGNESDLFYETLDTFMSIRKLLNMHRQNLPVRLRCHAIPRPNIGPSKKTDPETPFIDLGETLMCSCRGCQGFVLMGCSPCVAAERSLQSSKVQAVQLESDGDFQREIDDLGDFNLDDDALFSILSRVANN